MHLKNPFRLSKVKQYQRAERQNFKLYFSTQIIIALRQIQTLFCLLIFILMLNPSTSYQFNYPLTLATVRYISPSVTLPEFIKQIGNSSLSSKGLNEAYKIMILDGLNTASTVDKVKTEYSPVGLWSNIHKKIAGSMGTTLGTNDDTIQKNIIQKFHQSGILLLANTFSKEISLSSKGNPTLIAGNIASVILANNLDGVVIDWDDFHSVFDGSADLWILNFLKSLRNSLKKDEKIIVFNVYPSLIPSMSIFQDKNVNFYVDLFVIKYFNLLNQPFNTYESIFTNGSQAYPGTSIKSLLQNPKYAFDICRTVVSKPSSQAEAFQASNFVNDLTINSFFIRAFNQFGWFGGYANPNFNGEEAQNEFNFAKRAIADINLECIKTKSCYCI